jgi:hypothetical protein
MLRRVSLTKAVKNIYKENYKTLKNDTRKWKYFTYSWISYNDILHRNRKKS